ncbi:MAG: DMT family transporter, partial [Chitinophagaceae bacterium]
LLFWLSYFIGKPFRESIAKPDRIRLVLCALFGVAANQLLFFKGLSLTSPIHASLMMLLTPVLVILISVTLVKEKLSGLNYLGLLLGISGAALLIILSKKDAVASNPWLGDFFVLLNAASYAIYLVIVKPLMHKYRPVVVIRWVFLLGTLMVLPFGLNDFLSISWASFSWQHVAAVAFIVIGVTFFTYLWNIYALGILSSSIAGAYIYLQPVFAALIAVFMLNEAATWTKLFSACLIFLGVYFVSRRPLNR